MARSKSSLDGALGLITLITSQLFPWWRRQGKRTIELVDMIEHGFPSSFSLEDSLNVLRKLGLERPVYEDSLLTVEQQPEKQEKSSIMFPLSARWWRIKRYGPYGLVGVDGYLRAFYLWCYDGDRKLILIRSGLRWYSSVRVAGVRKSPA